MSVKKHMFGGLGDPTTWGRFFLAAFQADDLKRTHTDGKVKEQG